MATFDQLSEDQRAIIELLLQRGKSYDDLSDILGLPEDRVRELARSALVTLTPVTAAQVDSDWRGQLADYVLGQQTGPESTATKGHLRRSEAARAWTRSVLDSLDTLYEDGMPSIPSSERAPRERKPRRPEREEPAPDRERFSRASLSQAAQDAVRRRRLLAGAGALAVLLLIAILLWPIGVLTGDDNGDSSSSSNKSSTPASQQNGRTAGVAVIAQRGSQRQVIVQASLPANRQRQAYEVWLYNNKNDAKSLGAQVTNAQGQYQGAGPLPSDYKKFKYIDVSLEPIDQNRGHSGNSVLRGTIPKLKQPNPAKKNQAQILGQVMLQPVGG